MLEPRERLLLACESDAISEQVLYASGEDVIAADAGQSTPLHLAVLHGKTAVIKQLNEWGNAHDNFCVTTSEN